MELLGCLAEQVLFFLPDVAVARVFAEGGLVEAGAGLVGVHFEQLSAFDGVDQRGGFSPGGDDGGLAALDCAGEGAGGQVVVLVEVALQPLPVLLLRVLVQKLALQTGQVVHVL